MQRFGILAPAAFERLAIDGDVACVIVSPSEPAECECQSIGIERLKNVVVRRVARCLAVLDSQKRPQRKIALRSLAPASIAPIEIPSNDCSLYCWPCKPRLSGTSPSAPHNVLLIAVTSKLVTTR